MIEIDKSDRFPWSPYPAIDFKFLNGGATATILKQVVLEIVSADLDESPWLSFDYATSGEGAPPGALVVWAANDGWGEARDCELVLSSDILDEVYLAADRTFVGSVASAARIPIVTLAAPKGHGYPVRFQTVLDRYAALVDALTMTPGGRAGLPTDDLTISGLVHSVDGRAVRVNERPRRLASDGGCWLLQLRIGADGFYHEIVGSYAAMHLISTSVYVCLIDPTVAPLERAYSVSRYIPPGDAERFHVVVGATRSCTMSVKVRFYFDKSTVVESSALDISVQSGSISGSPHVLDGSEFELIDGRWQLTGVSKGFPASPR